MNLRLKKYKQNRLKGMNQYNAARAAGYSETTARTKNHKLEKSIKVDMIDLLDQVGLTDKALAEHIQEGLYESVKPYGKDGDEGPDWAARHKYCETILKLKGKLVEKPLIDQSNHEHVTLIINHPESKENGSQGNNESVRANAETSNGSRLLTL